jgi:GrpB-like predicted nucleotidyltransferase (UPF0157 family)
VVGELRFRDTAELWPLVDKAFQEHSRAICALLPAAQVEHMGATAVPGSITKGDLDLLVRVSASDFAAAVATLEDCYEIHQPENWTPADASFVDEEAGDVPVGVQLVVAGSDLDAAFVSIRSVLRGHPELVQQSNELKRSFEGGDPEEYVAAEQAFIESLLRDVDSARFAPEAAFPFAPDGDT